ncbi:DUF1778 domain-containing protein [Kitasatospora acidiphila]|uniref:type II toxin -antitoxin system TacA 1-like antitoxin n=1 Tax=Kitasatospora acidiphila TaxID=2567942 RepID=UPI003C711DDB
MSARKLSISVPPEVAETIKAAAAEEGKQVSAWLAEAAVEKAQIAVPHAQGRVAAREPASPAGFRAPPTPSTRSSSPPPSSTRPPWSPATRPDPPRQLPRRQAPPVHRLTVADDQHREGRWSGL